jgi:hypothetical protein
VYRQFPVVSLCACSADEVELVEFGGGVCAEVTHSLAQLLGIWCGGYRGGPSYIVIWEKR